MNDDMADRCAMLLWEKFDILIDRMDRVVTLLEAKTIPLIPPKIAVKVANPNLYSSMCRNCCGPVSGPDHECPDLPECPDGDEGCLACGRRLGWGAGHEGCSLATRRYVYKNKRNKQ